MKFQNLLRFWLQGTPEASLLHNDWFLASRDPRWPPRRPCCPNLLCVTTQKVLVRLPWNFTWVTDTIRAIVYSFSECWIARWPPKSKWSPWRPFCKKIFLADLGVLSHFEQKIFFSLCQNFPAQKLFGVLSTCYFQHFWSSCSTEVVADRSIVTVEHL